MEVNLNTKVKVPNVGSFVKVKVGIEGYFSNDDYYTPFVVDKTIKPLENYQNWMRYYEGGYGALSLPLSVLRQKWVVKGYIADKDWLYAILEDINKDYVIAVNYDYIEDTDTPKFLAEKAERFSKFYIPKKFNNKTPFE